MAGVLLFAVGFVAAALLWLGLVWIPAQLQPIDTIHAFAAARGARVRGDGRREPIVVLGSVAGRAFTLTWQRAPGAGDVLLLGIDCEAGDRSALPAPEGGESRTGDAALVTRWIRPSAAVLARLDQIVEEQAALAAELERADPSVERE